MVRQFRSKAFKSGNSVALRLPKNLGIVIGDEIVIAPHADGSFSFWKESDAKAVLMGLFGSMSPDFMADGRGDIEQGEREWSDRARSHRAA